MNNLWVKQYFTKLCVLICTKVGFAVVIGLFPAQVPHQHALVPHAVHSGVHGGLEATNTATKRLRQCSSRLFEQLFEQLFESFSVVLLFSSKLFELIRIVVIFVVVNLSGSKVFPTNSWERAFSVVVLCFALLVFRKPLKLLKGDHPERPTIALGQSLAHPRGILDK